MRPQNRNSRLAAAKRAKELAEQERKNAKRRLARRKREGVPRVPSSM
jgi:hypothetical protein